MDDFTVVLSSVVADRVRYYELVRAYINGHGRKLYIIVADRGLYLVMHNLSGMLREGSIHYENIENITLNPSGTLITIHLRKSLVTSDDNSIAVVDIQVETPYHTPLYGKMRVAVDTNYIMNHYKEPPTDDQIVTETERTLSPFIGYKKVVLGDYFFFVRDTFMDTTFSSGYVTRLEDGRGVIMTVSIRDPVPIGHLELEDPKDLYDYSRGFLEEIRTIECGEWQEGYLKPYQILRDEIYNKKMNLNNDIALWSCYHILIRTNTKLIAFFALRRSLIPPLLDVCQDICVRFDIWLNQGSNSQLSDLWNEFCLCVNSFTSTSPGFIWHRDFMQVRVDNLRFEHNIYPFLKMVHGIVPSYYKLVKGFIGSLLNLLPHGSIDQYLLLKLQDKDSKFRDEPMEYVYRIVTLIYGIGSSSETATRKRLVNGFKMRLANYLAFCIDELTMGQELSLGHLVRFIKHMDSSSQKKLHDAIKFMMHFRSADLVKDYSPELCGNIIETYKSKRSGIDWRDVFFNSFAVSRFLEEGYFSVHFDEPSSRIALNNEVEEWDGYVNILCDLMEIFDDYKIQKRMCRRILQLPLPVPLVYLPLVNCMVGLLKRAQPISKITSIILSILINFSFHSEEFKDKMIQSDLVHIIIGYLLWAEDELTLLSLKIMTNLTKTRKNQERFIEAGAVTSLVAVLENYYKKNVDIVASAAGVIGQLCNVKNAIPSIRLEYISDIIVYTFHTGAGSTEGFIKILFCLRKLSVNRHLMTKFGQHCIDTLIFNLKCKEDHDFLASVFQLLIDLAATVYNCKLMRKCGLLDTLSRLETNVDSLMQMSAALQNKVLRKTRYCYADSA